MHVVTLTSIISAIPLIVYKATSSLSVQLPSEEIEEICRSFITFHLSNFVGLTFNLLQDQSQNVNETTFRNLLTLVLIDNGIEAASAPLSEHVILRTKTEQADFVIGFRVNETAEEALAAAETHKSKLSRRGKDILCMMGINYRHDIGAARERLICNWVVNLYDRSGALRTSFPRRELVYWKPIDVKRRESVHTYYETLEILGVGKSSEVVRCREKETGDIFAAKIIRKQTLPRERKKRIRREIHIMNQLHHPNLLRLLDTFEDDDKFVLIVEYLSGGRLSERGSMSESEAVNYVKQICEAVKYLHERNIFHCDLTRSNIVCRAKGCNEIVLIDFGESHELALKKEKAPSTECEERDDMLSIGVIAGFLLTGTHPTQKSRDRDHTFWNISTDGKDFIKRLLVWDSDRRPMNIYESLNHSWLNQR